MHVFRCIYHQKTVYCAARVIITGLLTYTIEFIRIFESIDNPLRFVLYYLQINKLIEDTNCVIHFEPIIESNIQTLKIVLSIDSTGLYTLYIFRHRRHHYFQFYFLYSNVNDDRIDILYKCVISNSTIQFIKFVIQVQHTCMLAWNNREYNSFFHWFFRRYNSLVKI